MSRISRPWLIVLAALTLLLGTLAAWLTGSPQPLANASDNLGQSLLPFGSVVAGSWIVLAAVGLVVGLAAVRAEPGTVLHRHRRPIVLGVCVGAGLALDHSLLMVAGYVPFATVAALTGRADMLGRLLSPALALQVALVIGLIALLLELRARTTASPERRDAGTDQDRARRQARRWTLIAMEAPIAYAVTRVLMFVQAPGFSLDDAVARQAALGLAVASVGGAVLTWGLIRPWGERFPRWMVGLAGRRVPIDLAVIPAILVGALVLAASRGILVGMVDAGDAAWQELTDAPLVALPHLLWPLWGCALIKAALAYRQRRVLTEAAADEPAQRGVAA